MENREEFEKRQAREREAFERMQAIASACPIPPRMVTSETSRIAWVTLPHVKTLREALESFKAFRVVPSWVWKSSSTMICPDSAMSERDRERYGESSDGPFACWIDTDQGEGYGPNAKLCFYASLPSGEMVRVIADFGAGYIGKCDALRAPCSETRKNRSGRVIARQFRANPEIHAIADKFISWGSGDIGPVKQSAHMSYLFAADTADESAGEEMTHAIGMLEILADRAQV